MKYLALTLLVEGAISFLLKKKVVTVNATEMYAKHF